MIEGEKIRGSSSWTRDDDIAFERALAIYPDESESRWEQIAQVVPGKTLEEIREHYKILVYDVIMIESGCVPLPDYDSSVETNYNSSEKGKCISECGNNGECDYKQKCESKQKLKRRKGIAWTAIEHRQFLLGLEKYGKGDWRSISRNFVITRTPTQVASHAQKYFARLKSQNNKNQKRSSIHDIAVAETRNIPTKQTPITWQNQNHFNVAAASSNTQPSLDLPLLGSGTPFVWNSQAVVSQPSVSIPMYGTHTIGQPMLLPFGTDMNRSAPPPMAYHSVSYPSAPSAPINTGSSSYKHTHT